ncbi:MAG: ATP-binding protein [Acidobacteriales bacterium]|nr:MAG: ATP-binding protein [Terriglobales bacterium]
MDLIALLQRPEGKTLEYKRDLSTPDGLLKTLVAFANTAGGVRTRSVIGIPEVSAAEERLSNMVVDSILPRLVPNIEIVPWRKTHVLVVQVSDFADATARGAIIRKGNSAGLLTGLLKSA